MDQDQRERLELEKLELARAKLNQEQRAHLEIYAERLREEGLYAPKHEAAIAHVIYEGRAPVHQRADIQEVFTRAHNDAQEREAKERLAAKALELKEPAHAPQAQADVVLDAQRQHEAEARDRQQRDAETTRLILQAAHPNRQREIGRYDELKRMGEEARPDPRPLVSDWRATAHEVCDRKPPTPPTYSTGLKPTPSPNSPYDPTAARATAQDILDHKSERSDRVQKNPTREDGRENNPANTPTHGRSRGGRTW